MFDGVPYEAKDRKAIPKLTEPPSSDDEIFTSDEDEDASKRYE